MDDLYYEGWDAIERAWREGLTPDPLLTVSEWADKHRVLSSKAASEPGRRLVQHRGRGREVVGEVEGKGDGDEHRQTLPPC